MFKQVLAFVLTGLLLAATPAFAATLPDRIIFQIGDAPPGTHDVAGRIIAKHLPKVLEARTGKPVEVLVENVGGSNGAVLLKKIASLEQTDGSVIAFGNPMARTVSYLANNTTLDFDPTKIEFVAGISRSIPLCLALRDRTPDPATMRIGFTSRTGTPFLNSKVASLVLGPDVQLIGGFKALEELPAAMERNEIDAYSGLTYDTFRRERRDKELQIIYKLTNENVSGLESVPSLLAELPPDLATILPMLLVGNRCFQTAYLPAGVDPDILELYRAAFSDLAADENFKKDLKAAVITLTFAGGAEVDAFRQQLIDTDPALWQKAYELIAPPK